jgi:excisionase family DNA binding protein
MSSDVLTIREVAEYLKVTEKTVYSLAQRRRIPAFKVGGQWRFRREDMESWIDVQTEDTVGATSSESAAEARPNGPKRRAKQNGRR